MSNCTKCGALLNPRESICDHCTGQNDSPNVRLAKSPTEVSALDAKYTSVFSGLSREDEKTIRKVEACVRTEQKVAVARSALEIAKFLATPNALYQTYHQQVFSSGKYAGTGPIDSRRIAFENAALPNLADQTVFGSLSIADQGQPNFGNTTMILSADACEPRTSFFWGNPYVLSQQMGLTLVEVFPEGFRSTWEDAFKLVVCKHHKEINGNALSVKNCHEMINRSSSDGDPDYIEAHYWKGFPASVISKIVFSSGKDTSENDKLAWKMIKLHAKATHPQIQCEEA